MAKKKKKYLIKLNNKIRNYFNGAPFDEGVTTLTEDKLIELIMLLEITLVAHTKDDMIRALRRIWSEEGAGTRELIVSYLTQPYKSITKGKRESQPVDKVEKILYLLCDIPHSNQEENTILESFIDINSSKITAEKIKNKLYYLRFSARIHQLESLLDITFDTQNKFSFYHSFTFNLKDFDFNKLLLCTSESLEIETLFKQSDTQIQAQIEKEKELLIQKKQQVLEDFLKKLRTNTHLYLDEKEIEKALRSMPPESDLSYAALSFSTIDNIITKHNPKYHIFESEHHIIIEKEKSHDLFNTPLGYTTSVSYEKPFFYHLIWNANELPILDDINAVNDTLIAHFQNHIEDILLEMQKLSQKLSLESSILHEHILRFIVPKVQSAKTLTLKDKVKRRIIFHFTETIAPLLEQQKREELLAKTIRDFKHLFPLARAIKREIIFHVGPTNSGKTYTAIKALKEANTGYYLAPLRLLALEGYENLKKENIPVSLITGEEEILDENSTHISSTIEMMNHSVDVDVCVIDEIQMIHDRDRGWAWANALIGIPAKKVILTGSSNALKLIEEMCEYLEEKLTVIHFERKNTLEALPLATPLKDITPQTAIVAFSRKDVLSLRQQLMGEYQVSVIYGNLSPEVRKEEARRFREGESQILVSTDAIAMGLNLPIKTILFAKDNKFDGLRRRQLLAQEVTQIAGRAGRYGLEDKGFVGALEENALAHISQALHTPLEDIELPVSVMASLEHVLLIGEILDTSNISTILTFFVDNMEFDGPFTAANIDTMLEIAAIVDNYSLDLKTRYFLSCAPASVSSPYLESVFHRYIKQIEANAVVLYIPPRDLPSFAQTNDMLLNAEDRVREISLYLWLSFKFPEYFQDTQKALNARQKLNQFIENSLRQGNFTKQCRRCGKVLNFSYRFSICDNCHGGRKRGSSSYISKSPQKRRRRSRS